ncbi:hypothetical protein ACFL35_09125 [Candidatus Riflebacteria bacterium]
MKYINSSSMKVENTIHNPTLHFRLDPGEPGLAPPTPASRAALTVIQQEMHNLNRFVNDSTRENRTVVKKRVTYDVAFAGNFLTVRGGHTEVKSIPTTELARSPINPEPEQPGLTTTTNEEPKSEPNILGNSDDRPTTEPQKFGGPEHQEELRLKRKIDELERSLRAKIRDTARDERVQANNASPYNPALSLFKKTFLPETRGTAGVLGLYPGQNKPDKPGDKPGGLLGIRERIQTLFAGMQNTGSTIDFYG